jgi:hypothetical protein
LQTADRGWPSSLEVGQEAKNPTVKIGLLWNITYNLRCGQILWDYLSTRKWIYDLKHGTL